MRYGINDQRPSLKQADLFPVQSSVLDEVELLSKIVTDYAITNPVSCRFLSRGDSDIYRVKTPTANFYLKIYRPPQSPEISEAEARFVSALSEAGMRVVKPVRRGDGSYACQVPAPEGIRPILLFEEAPPPLPKELDGELLFQIGEQTAVLHELADKFESSFGIPEIDLEAQLRQRLFFTSQFLSVQDKETLEEISTKLKQFLQEQPRTSPDFGLCHADLVLSNIRLARDGKVEFFDFGNLLRIWRAFELAVIYSSVTNRFKSKGEVLWKSFLQGYQTNRLLPKLAAENLAVFLVLRQIRFLGGNCATLPLRLGTEPFESGFIEDQFTKLKRLFDESGL